MFTAFSNSLFDAVYRTPWPSLAVQCWHGYVMAHGALQVRLLDVALGTKEGVLGTAAAVSPALAACICLTQHTTSKDSSCLLFAISLHFTSLTWPG
jgi:hypothetical protein